MPRPNRVAVPHCPHHVRQRGVRKEPLFYDDSDFLVYKRLLKEGCEEHAVEVRSYTFMTNHEHLILVPETEIGISKALHFAHTSYSGYFNTKYRFVGHVWQSRPDITVMDEKHMWNAIRYVERNPVRAGMVKRAEDYLWSSAAAHCGLRNDFLLSKTFPPPGVIENWSEWLKIEQTEDEIKAIRLHTKTGRPWVTPEFLSELEALTGKRLRPRKPGRPKREKSGSDHSFPYFPTNFCLL